MERLLPLLALLTLAAPALAGPPGEEPEPGGLVVGSPELRVVSDAMVRREGRWVLVGVLVNNGDRAYSDITVRFGLYNKIGERVGDIEGQVERLEPGQRVTFRAPVYIPGATVTTEYQSGTSETTQNTANPAAPAVTTQAAGETTRSTAENVYYRPDTVIAISQPEGGSPGAQPASARLLPVGHRPGHAGSNHNRAGDQSLRLSK